MTEENKVPESLSELSEETLAHASDSIQEQALAQAEAHLDAVHPRAKDKSPLAGVPAVDFDALTAKSQQFMMTLDRQLIDALDYEARSSIYAEMVETLLAGQQAGQTARQLYGTPTQVAESVMNKEIKQASEPTEKSPDWQIAVDGGLILGSIFTLLSGFSIMRNGVQPGASFGLLTMIVNYIIAGYAILITSKNMPNPDAPKGKKGYFKYFFASFGSMMVWFAGISVTNLFVPVALNPVFSGPVYLAIGAITIGIRYWFKKHYHVRGGLF